LIRTVAVSRAFGDRALLEPTDWFLADTDRVGLVGPNGSGKSTWLKILCAWESPDAGRIDTPKGQRVGYLPQFGFEPGRGTVVEEARRAFGSILELQDEKTRIERSLESPAMAAEEAEALLTRHDRIEQEIRRLDGHEIDRRVDRVLRGLGFQAADFSRPVEELSGGWQVRLSLARLLLEAPDVLLLDEPTNHLDLEAREWLEGYLQEYAGSFVLVSHDRYFLDVTVTRVTEIMNRRLVDYTGNYSRYLEEREARYEQARKAYERQRDEIRRIETFIERFRYKNTKASQVQSRIKMLEKLPRLEPPVAPPRAIHFRFPQPDRTGRMVLELRRARKAYGKLEVFRGVDLQLERGQKVALVGPNGAGKSTLMRILAGAESFDGGERLEGLRVSIDHFAQDQADRLPPDQTVLQVAISRAPNQFVPQVRGLLGAFLFSGDEVEKKISVLSGGERNRLALALMLMKPCSVLLLDEPTNHLDMQAKDVLLAALREFDGTVVFVSHDRHFLAGLSNRVIEVGGGGVREFGGDYEGYLWRKRQEEERLLDAAGGAAGGDSRGARALAAEATSSRNGGEPAEDVPGAARKNRVSPRQVRAMESKIAALEERKEKLEALLSREDLYRDQEKSGFYLNEYRDVTRALEEAIEQWAASAGTAEEV
jgi:ATP-binding cassette, subfamily F, member 3